MNTIESKLDELNTICFKYPHESGTLEEKSRIRELFSDLVKCGYRFVTLTIEPNTPEYEVLSDDCKKLCHQMHETRKKKIVAIDNKEFEKAADLRDLERILFQQVISDFSKATDYKFFVLLSKDSNEIIFNDPKGQLKEMFKKT
jgi:hypothetical protein